MKTLEEAWAAWQNLIPEREEARAEAIGKVDQSKKRRLADLNVEMAQLRAKIASLKAEIGMERVQYVRGAFDSYWQLEKSKRREELEEAIAHEMNNNGATGYQLAQRLGTKNINLFYNVKQQEEGYRREQAKEVTNLDWAWHRFTGTHRYALADTRGNQEPVWCYVLMKGTLDSELEGESCIFDFQTGAYVSGNKDVYESDTDANRRKRADTLAEILDGTYTGKIKSSPNPYFEEVE